MGSAQVSVSVFDRGRRIDGPLLRPVRLLPDDRAGAVYGGEVYPLYAGNTIDLADAGIDKYACPRFVPVGALIPYARSSTRTVATDLPPKAEEALLPSDAWYLESNRFGHYLVFDADETAAERVVDRLDAGDLGVRRWDVSHRPADNGRHYDWFVRLAYEGDRQSCLSLLYATLGDSGAMAGAEASALDAAAALELPDGVRAAVIEVLQRALAAVRENSRLKEQLAASEDSLTTSRRSSDSLQLRLQMAEAEAETTLASLRARLQAADLDRERALADHRSVVRRIQVTAERQIQRLRDELAAQQRSTTKQPALSDLERQLVESSAEQDRLFEEFAAADTRASEAEEKAGLLELALAGERHEKDALRAQLDQLQALHQESAGETAEKEKAAGRARATRHSIDRFLGKVLSRTELDPDSLETLLSFTSPAKALRELVRIDDEDQALRSRVKKVQGYPHWWEISKITIGTNSPMGRIYYRPHQDGVEAVIHHKKDDDEQRRFLARRLGRT